MPETSHAVETELLNRVASDPDCWWKWTDHAELRLAQGDHNADDVMYALMYGQVMRVDVQEDIVFRVKEKT